MPRRRAGMMVVLGLLLSGAAPAAAAPVTGPHQVVDSQWTTTQPGASTGFTYSGRYHAAGDPSAPPPYMRRMVFENAAGVRYDTGAVPRCTASDVELAVRGAAACPAGSRLGGGTTETSFMGMPPSRIEIGFFNNTDEQVIVVRSPLVTTVARGRIHPDGSIEFASPTCYPSLGSVPCPVDSVLQLGTEMSAPVRAGYMTTPPTCPASGHWESPVHFWWADGSADTVVTRQACARAPSTAPATRAQRRRPCGGTPRARWRAAWRAKSRARCAAPRRERAAARSATTPR